LTLLLMQHARGALKREGVRRVYRSSSSGSGSGSGGGGGGGCRL
jgi:hypothetical protein